MKALFSTTKPYITHTGPASLARSCLICHSRTYVCSPSSEQEDHILQLILQNSKTRLSTLSARYSFTSHTVDPSLVSIRCRILVCCSCCSLGRPGTFFQGSFDTISLIQPFQALERRSLLCVPQRFVGTFPLVSIPVSFASMIFHNNVGTTRAGLCWVLSPQLTQSFPNRGLLN